MASSGETVGSELCDSEREIRLGSGRSGICDENVSVDLNVRVLCKKITGSRSQEFTFASKRSK